MKRINIEKLVAKIISESGDDSKRSGLKSTPERVAKLFEEMLSGYSLSLKKVVEGSLFETNLDDMIVIKDIEFYLKI